MDRLPPPTAPIVAITFEPEILAPLLRKVPIAAAVNSAIALLTWLTIPTPAAPFWLMLILTASLIRFLPTWMARRDPARLHTTWFSCFLLATIVLQGASWGFGAATLYQTATAMQKFLVLTVICGMIGGSILTLSPSVAGYLCFALPAAMPLIGIMLLSGEEIYQYAGGMGSVYVIAIFFLSQKICLNHLELLHSRRRLEETSAELVRHQHHLEGLVESRTRELAESRESYRRLIEEINDAIYEIDDKGNIRYLSPAITPLLEYLPSELLGRNVAELAHPEDRELVLLRIAAILGGGEHHPLDCRFLTKSGATCWLRVTSQPVLTDGKPAGLRGMATGINEEKQAEQEKNKLARKIQETRRLESIGTLAGGIAHDFNNLLMGIQGRVTLISMDMPTGHPALEHTRAIEKYVSNGADLTRQLLATARGGKYDPKPTDIGRLVEQNLHLFSRTRKELTTRITMPPQPMVAEVDSAQLEQVLLNMFINSSQAMPQGGSLSVSVAARELDPSFCRPYRIEPGPYIEIAITDTGSGMDAQTLERIFDPFFTTREMGRGTGLGLSSAHGIIVNHRGCITVTSTPGKGTTFTLFLPRSSAPPSQLTEQPTTLAQGRETILVVDDEDMIIDVAEAILTKIGYTVLVARDGRQAIALLKQYGEHIHLVLLDMIMPGIDGGTTFNELRAIRPDLPVLLSSGYSLNDQALEIMQRGCNGFIEKPFTLAKLSSRIRTILDSSRN